MDCLLLLVILSSMLATTSSAPTSDFKVTSERIRNFAKFLMSKPQPQPLTGAELASRIKTAKALKFTESHLKETIRVPFLGTVKLTCRSSAVPAPTIHWMKNGKRVYQNPAIDELVSNTESPYKEGILFSGTQSQYEETCVEYSATYTCVAETPTKKITRVIEVIVDNEMEEGLVIPDHCKIHNDNERRKERSASANENESPLAEVPQIYMWTNSLRAAIGAKLQIYCRAKGVHPSTVQWAVKALFSPEFIPITEENASLLGFEQLANGDLKTESLASPSKHGGMFSLKCSVGHGDMMDEKITRIFPSPKP